MWRVEYAIGDSPRVGTEDFGAFDFPDCQGGGEALVKGAEKFAEEFVVSGPGRITFIVFERL